MKNILVIFGGQSVEHDVSIITGVLTLNSIDKEIFNPIPVYISKDLQWFTGKKLFDIDFYKNFSFEGLDKVSLIAGDNSLYVIKGKKIKKLHTIAVCVNCTHGELGEDGSLVGLLNMCKIPVASSTLLPSSVAMDKSITKIFLQGLKVNVLPSIEIFSAIEIEKVKNSLNYPLIVKPNRLGSSIGIEKIISEKDIVLGVERALKYGESVIIEPLLNDFIEINCACYKDKKGQLIVSECERPVGKDEVLSFDDKYQQGRREFPAKITKKQSDKIKELTKRVYEKLKFNGIIRIDYFLTKSNVYLNEINSVPGSLAYYLFCPSLKEFKNLLTEQIMVAEGRYIKELTAVKEFKSSILTGFGSKGAKHL